MSPTLIAASPAHAELLAALHQACFAAGWTTQTFSELLAMPGAYGLIATEFDSPRGFILCRTAADEAEIITFAVLPDHRRQGLGHALLDRAAGLAGEAGAAALFLEVAADNRAARSLYAGHGFREVGRRPRYYADGSDALVMRLPL